LGDATDYDEININLDSGVQRKARKSNIEMIIIYKNHAV
jgi:hypothetical protein